MQAPSRHLNPNPNPNPNTNNNININIESPVSEQTTKAAENAVTESFEECTFYESVLYMRQLVR